MSGTIISNNMSLASSATVSLVSNGKTITKDVTVPPPDGMGAQSVAYSFSGVETITADVTLTVSSTNGWGSGKTVGCEATQDTNALSWTVSGDTTKVFTLPGVSIAKSTTINVQLCSPVFTSGTNTVSGTITSNSMALATDATVALSSNGVTITQHVVVPPPDNLGAQSVSYSFLGVQNITADVTLTATSSIWSPTTVGCSFTVNGGIPTTGTPSGGSTEVFTLPGVSITKPTTIDVQLYPADFTNGPNIVSGTITSYNMDLAPDATIALTCNGITVTQHVTFPAPDANFGQVATYSFSGVQDITANVVLTATSANQWDSPNTVNCVSSQLGATIPSGTGNTKAFPYNSISISGPTTIDLNLQPVPTKTKP